MCLDKMSSEDTDPPLPPELWRGIINSYMSFNDSCSLALVSNNMWGRAREHKNWRNMELNWENLKKRGAASLFECPSFGRIKTLCLSEFGIDWSLNLCSDVSYNTDSIELLNDLLQHSLRCSTLEEMEFELDVSLVSADLLSNAVSKLRGVIFPGPAQLTNQQLIKILEKSPNLVKLIIPYSKLDNQGVKLLANNIIQLSKLDISRSEFTTIQIKDILEKAFESSTLTELNLESVELSEISEELLASVCFKLHKVNLDYTNLSSEQITSILKICSTSSTLKYISLSNLNVSRVSLEVLSIAIPKFVEVQMKKSSLTDNQQVQIFIKCLSSTILKKLFMSSESNSITLTLFNSTPRRYTLKLTERTSFLSPLLLSNILTKSLKSSTLYKLDLSGMNLSGIPSMTIANRASLLHTINLDQTRLSTEAITIILKVLLKSTKIKEINLSRNNLTDVSADLLAEFTDKLDIFYAEACGLTTNQLTKILQTSAVCYITFNNLSEINPDIIYNKNICKKDNKILSNTSLTTQQVIAIFQNYFKSHDELLKFTMSHQNLSEVPVDLLSKFVSKFTEVSLTDCNLNQEQITVILQNSIQSPTLKSLHLDGNTLYSNMPEKLIEKLYQLRGKDGKYIYDFFMIDQR